MSTAREKCPDCDDGVISAISQSGMAQGTRVYGPCQTCNGTGIKPTARKTLQAAIDSLGLTIRAEFVPWSKSRHAKEDKPSLNWRITVVRNGRDVLTTDYGAGLGHCPSFKQGDRSEMQRRLIAWECEQGMRGFYAHNADCVMPGTTRKPILPDTCSVIASLVSDSDALNYSTFEEWASDHDVNPDSRVGEKTYRASLEIGLAMRRAIGDSGLRALIEACKEF